jgi:hypothetical protein
MRVEVSTAVVTKSSIFWHIATRSSVKVNRRFGRKQGLRLTGRRVSQARNQLYLLPVSCRFTACFLIHAGFLLFDPEDGGDMFRLNVGYFHPNTRRYIPEGRTLHLYTHFEKP